MTTMEDKMRPLEAWTSRLGEGLLEYENESRRPIVREGVVFQYKQAFDASHRALRSYLQDWGASASEFELADFSEIVETSKRIGLLQTGWSRWDDYGAARRLADETDEEAAAESIVQIARQFLSEAQFLVNQLRARWSSAT